MNHGWSKLSDNIKRILISSLLSYFIRMYAYSVMVSRQSAHMIIFLITFVPDDRLL
jgi:hypothetical protein